MKKYIVKGYYYRLEMGGYKTKVKEHLSIKAENPAEAIVKFNVFYNSKRGKWYKGYQIEAGGVEYVAEVVWEV